MSEAFIVRRGGSGGLSAGGAVLHITAPAGSTITLKKGDVTVATLAAARGHTNASDTTLADWYYAIVSTNYGSWTATAARDGETASGTVTVDSNKVYDLSLSFGLYLIRNGQLQSGYSLYGNNTISQESDHVLAKGGSGTVVFCSVGPVSGITYPYLIVKASDEKINNSTAKFGITSTSAYSQNAWLAHQTFGVHNQEGALSWHVDVSGVSFSTDRYAALGLELSSYWLKITDLYFSRVVPT
ncbi:MAG: hypothetical protein Q4E45_10125 [Eubacteriales bacterium]|nr:hypothetical protein [Eubacteriales bacterium]